MKKEVYCLMIHSYASLHKHPYESSNSMEESVDRRLIASVFGLEGCKADASVDVDVVVDQSTVDPEQ